MSPSGKRKTETDSRIRAALAKNTGSATVILISHRITTLRHADCIAVMDDGKVVGIIGVESEPMPCTWKDFCAAMNEQFEDIPFTPAYWSDSRWVHLVSTYDLVIRIYTTDATDDGLVQSILVNTPYADGAEDVQIVTACAFHAVAQPGTYGSYAVSIALEEEHSDDWFTEQPIQIWMENGYAFSFCQTDNFRLPCGMVEYLEQMQVSGGYLPLEDEYYYLPDGISTSDLIDELSAQANSGPLASWLSAPVLPDMPRRPAQRAPAQAPQDPPACTAVP